MKKYIKKYNFKKGKIILFLEIKGVPLMTNYYSNVTKVLSTYLPSIFNNKCFNPKNINFIEESKCTEIGHLFEHILLEQMCLIKIPYVDEISYSGRTYWRKNTPDGRFRIEINCNLYDYTIFIRALRKTNLLMDKILKSKSMIIPSHQGQFRKITTPGLRILPDQYKSSSISSM